MFCHRKCKHKKNFAELLPLPNVYNTPCLLYFIPKLMQNFQKQLTTSSNIKLIFHFRPVSPCPLIIAYLNIEFLFLNFVDSMNQLRRQIEYFELNMIICTQSADS